MIDTWVVSFVSESAVLQGGSCIGVLLLAVWVWIVLVMRLMMIFG